MIESPEQNEFNPAEQIKPIICVQGGRRRREEGKMQIPEFRSSNPVCKGTKLQFFLQSPCPVLFSSFSLLNRSVPAITDRSGWMESFPVSTVFALPEVY